jgi:hypothetical protein
MVVQTPPGRPYTPDPEIEAGVIEDARARQRSHRRIGLLIAAIVAVIVAIAVVIAAAVRLSTGRAGSVEPTSNVARLSSSGDRYWYTRTLVPASHVVIETWIGLNGTVRRRELAVSGSRGTVVQDWVVTGLPSFPWQANGSPSDPGDSLFSYRQLLALSTAPARLAAALEDAEAAYTTRDLDAYVQPGPLRTREFGRLLARANTALPADELDAIGTLAVTPISPRLRLALIAAATHLPGISAATHDLTITLTADNANPPEDSTFNTSSGEVLTGTAQAPGRVLAQGPSTSIDAIPTNIKPLVASARIPQATIEPRTASPTQTLTLRLPANTGQPTLALLFGPTGPNCHFWASRPPTVTLPAPRHSDNIDQITLSPHILDRSSWCTGNYQLQVQRPGTHILGTFQGSAANFTIAPHKA